MQTYYFTATEIEAIAEAGLDLYSKTQQRHALKADLDTAIARNYADFRINHYRDCLNMLDATIANLYDELKEAAGR